MTNDKLEAARTGNWFSETPLAIARLDKLARDEEVQTLPPHPGKVDGILVICDEAHKMSASFFGGEIRYTKRYRLGSDAFDPYSPLPVADRNSTQWQGRRLPTVYGPVGWGPIRRPFSEMECTLPTFSDLMRRMVKERLFKFDTTPLFPERRAYAVPFKLSDNEARLYREVTEYVREEFNRAESASETTKNVRTVGFALTILQTTIGLFTGGYLPVPSSTEGSVGEPSS